MTIFDLLFLAIVFVSVFTLAAVVIIALTRHFKRAGRMLEVYAVGLALYLAAVVVVSLASPQHVLAFGEDRCFDDWCIAVDSGSRSESPAKTEYAITLRLSSRALRITQRENGVVVYVQDETGLRFDAIADPAAVPLNVLLLPGQSVTTSRTFDVSSAAGTLSLVIEHDGWNRFPGVIIIGDDSSLFHKPLIVRLP
jgi:hypothetical protein